MAEMVIVSNIISRDFPRPALGLIYSSPSPFKYEQKLLKIGVCHSQFLSSTFW